MDKPSNKMKVEWNCPDCKSLCDACFTYYCAKFSIFLDNLVCIKN